MHGRRIDIDDDQLYPGCITGTYNQLLVNRIASVLLINLDPNVITYWLKDKKLQAFDPQQDPARQIAPTYVRSGGGEWIACFGPVPPGPYFLLVTADDCCTTACKWYVWPGERVVKPDVSIRGVGITKALTTGANGTYLAPASKVVSVKAVPDSAGTTVDGNITKNAGGIWEASYHVTAPAHCIATGDDGSVASMAISAHDRAAQEQEGESPSRKEHIGASEGR